MDAAVVDRFVSGIQEDETGSWLWRADSQKSRYGLFNLTHSQPVLAHRFSYELHVGAIPEGLELDHLCRKTRCVHFDHLDPVTQAENIRRAGAAITHCPQGHDYDEHGVTYYGKRQCKLCSRENVRRWRDRNRPAGYVKSTERTHCSAGHEFTPENTKWRQRGEWRNRICRLCTTAYNKRKS